MTSIMNIKWNDHLSDNVNRSHRKLHKVKFMAELLYWIALDCTGIPNEVGGECMLIGKSYNWNTVPQQNGNYNPSENTYPKNINLANGL